MIYIDIPIELLLLLRNMLLLLPLIIIIIFGIRHIQHKRMLVAGLFSFLYSFGLLLPAHILAIELNYWQYGGNSLMLMGMPADLWVAGSLLFGPALFFAFPKFPPYRIASIALIIHGVSFQSLAPFVSAGDNWFLGVCIIFLIIHMPALYLAQWTEQDIRLQERAALLALGYGFCVTYRDHASNGRGMAF